jgi:hypothetical protein
MEPKRQELLYWLFLFVWASFNHKITEISEKKLKRLGVLCGVVAKNHTGRIAFTESIGKNERPSQFLPVTET